MSIYGHYPDRNELHFLYKITGAGTRFLSTLKPSMVLNAVGPLGVGFAPLSQRSKLMIVARGVGLATLAPLVLEASRKGAEVTAICSARSPEFLMSIDYFRELGAHVVPVTDLEGTSSVKHVGNLVEAAIASGSVSNLYTCGSNRLLHLLRDIAKRHGLPGEVALEQQMACGIGMCQCCVKPFSVGGSLVHKRVCRDGPVFDLMETTAW